MLCAALALLILAALSVGHLDTWLASKQQYTILFRNSSLLPTGAMVSYAGLPVGQVMGFHMRSVQERQRQHPDYAVAVHVRVRAAVPVRDDSRVEMKTDGMIGDRYIDILPGMGSPLTPNGMLLGDVGRFDQLFETFAGAGGDVEHLLATVQNLLVDTSQPHSIPNVLASLQRLLAALPPYLPTLMTTIETLAQQIQQDVASTSQSAKALLTKLDKTVADNRAGLKHLIHDLNTTLDDTRQALHTAQSLLAKSQGRIPQTLDHLQALIGGIQESRRQLANRLDTLLVNMDAVVVHNDRNLYEKIENLRQMTEHLEATAELVRANPAVVIWGRRDGDPSPPRRSPSTERLKDRGRLGRYDRVR
ncbi:hypothetical protein C2W62_26275 [Candidatus Entotheonella serta]|nr:hypothetical protein C2W62_26275 [Candidatus Entotheonella serta]